MVAFLIMPLSLGFKNLYYEYKEIWKTAKLDRKIFYNFLGRLLLFMAFITEQN